MARISLLSIGNGNDGNYPHARIEFSDTDCEYSFMDMVIPNMFVSGHRARSYAYQNVMVDGEEEFSIYATLYENYNGETEMGAAFKTARLEPLKEGEYDDINKWEIRQWLDLGAYRKYKKAMRDAKH